MIIKGGINVHNMKRRVMGSLMAVLMGTSTILGSCPAPIFAVPTASEEEVVVDSAKVNANSYGLVSVTEGNILHAWNWSLATIKEQLPVIAEAGYSVVQTSPLQSCENYTNNNDWWKSYQPYDYAYGELYGTEADFKELCEEAHKYGISIIVDVVANHVAGSQDGSIKDGVDSYWKSDKSALFHNKTTTSSDTNRVNMVLSNIGMPDINTENEQVQARLVDYMQQLIDDGADGFRFDAAKHIGTSSDTGESYSNFWVNTVGKIKAKYPDKLYYGEILNDMQCTPDPMSYYVKDGLKVTESQVGWGFKDAVQKKTLKTHEKSGKAEVITYNRSTVCNIAEKDQVNWVENHDTYLNYWGSTGRSGADNFMSDDQIVLSWSALASRADTQSLYFARPDGCSMPDKANPTNDDSNHIDGTIEKLTSNTYWKNSKVVAVNKFKNAMIGENESVSTSGNAVIVKRGNKGAVVTNFGSADKTVEVTGLSGLADGTYKDASGQNGSITVSGGKASITVKGSTFAVLYDESAVTTGPTATPTPDNGEVVVSASKENSKFTDSFDVTVTAKNAQEAYYSYDGAEWVAFDETAKVTIGKEELKNGDEVGLYLYAFDKDGKAVEKSYTYTKEVKGTAGTGFSVRVKKSDIAEAPHIYVYNNPASEDEKAKEYTAGWPGDEMTAEGDYWVYSNAAITSALVIINQGDTKWPAGNDTTPGFTVSSPSEFSLSTEKMSEILSDVEQGDKKANKPASNPTFKGAATATPTPVVEALDVKASVEDGTSFTTETMDVELTLQNATSGTYSVDDGPEKTFTDKVTVKVGQGKIADRDVTLKVTAVNGTETTTKTYTYKKVFDKAAAAKEQAVVKTSAIKKLNSLFEVVADAAQVNTAAETDAYYATNPENKVGKKASIEIDGSFSDWSDDMLIAQGAAFDTATAFKGQWENCVMDSYALYGAWDDENLYIGFQLVNVYDDALKDSGMDLAGGPLSCNGKIGDLPITIAINTGKRNAMTGRVSDGKGIWGQEIEFETRVDNILVFHGDNTGTPGFFTATEDGSTNYETNCQKFTALGIEVESADGCLPKTIMGVKDNKGDVQASYSMSSEWIDFNTTTHDNKYDTFYEVKVPFSALGITASDVENNGVGVMQLIGRGESGMDCIPHDPSMLDNTMGDYAAQPTNSHEKDDTDTITVPLAAIGNVKATGEGAGGNLPTPNPATPTPSADVTGTPDTNVTTTPTATTTSEVTTGTSVTATPTATTTPEVTTDAGVTATPTTPVSGEAVTSMIVNFGAEKSAPQLTGKTLKLEAEGFNTTGKVTYEFAVDGTVVQAASEKASYDWFVGKAGNYTIQVTMADESGNKVVSTKTYTIEGEDAATATPEVTVSPTAVVATATPVLEVKQTATPTAIPATPTAEPTAEPTATPAPVKVTVKCKLGKASPQKVGTSIKIKVSSVTGGTEPYKFTYVASLKNGFTKTIAKNTTKKTVTWKPTKAGTYTIKVTAKDANGVSGTKKFTYKITNNKLAITKLKASAKKVKVKKKVKITVAGTAKTGTLKFKYVLKKGKTTKVLKKYSTKKTYTWKPTKAGKYKIIVYAKDGSGKSVKKSVTITVKKK